MRHILVISAWLFSFFAPMALDITYSGFYTVQIFFSVLLVYSLVIIDKYYPGGFFANLTCILLMILTTLFAQVNLATHVSYHFNSYFIYDAYGLISSIINTLEFMVLGIGTLLSMFKDGANSGIGLIGLLSVILVSSFHRSVAVQTIFKRNTKIL